MGQRRQWPQSSAAGQRCCRRGSRPPCPPRCCPRSRQRTADVDALDPPAQIALFNAFNRSRSCGQRLLLAGSQPPLALALREDLRTRIGQCLVYQLQPLDDETRAAIIATLAQRRGLPLASEVLDYLMCHGERELPRLLAVFEALDAAALERKRPITLPLLRELIQRGLQL